MRLFGIKQLQSILFVSSSHGNNSPFFLATTTSSSSSSSSTSAHSFLQRNRLPFSTTTTRRSMSSTNDQQQQQQQQPQPWTPDNAEMAKEAKETLSIWPLDEYNAALLNEVHPRGYEASFSKQQQQQQPQPQLLPHKVYDLIAIGAGAGGLVSSKQAARRGAKSAMISAHLAGGDCLNVGCVPSKALIRAARCIAEVKRCAEFGVVLPKGQGENGQQQQQQQQHVVTLDFAKVMRRLREKRTVIAPADGHAGTAATGAHVFQGFGKFTGPDTIEVTTSSSSSSSSSGASSGTTTTTTMLKFKKAVVATGGRPSVPKIPGLAEAPYTTNEVLFNLSTLPPRMVILGAGVIALEMAQCFARFGSQVTVLQRSEELFQSKHGDPEAAAIMQAELEKDGVRFVSGSTKQVSTLRPAGMEDPSELPLLQVTVNISGSSGDDEILDLECECLLVATGRVANVENLGLDAAGIQYTLGKGIAVNDLAQTTGNPNVYAVGDCVAGVPRLTHMSGEMAKLVVQNALFDDDWKLSSLVVPAVAYTEPEYATVGIYSAELAAHQGIQVDTYRAGLEHNDRAILESSNVGFCKIHCKAGTDEIVGCTIVAERAGEMINEVTLAMKNSIGLKAIGRNIHSYPTTGEAVMGCGIQYINSHWKRLD